MKKIIFSLTLLITISMSYFFLTSNSTGKMGAASTGCGGAGCHGTAANNFTQIVMFDGPVQDSWVPNQKYTMTINISNTNYKNAPNRAGFDLLASDGVLSNKPTNTMLMGTTELHHTVPRKMTSNGDTVWTFDWTAPAAGVGDVTFNIAANVTNGNSTELGDQWNLKTYTFKEGKPATGPKILSATASGITATFANVTASVNANGNSTIVTMEYGTSISYGSTAVVSNSPATGTSPVNCSASLTPLTANTLYHYRFKASNAAGKDSTADKTFTTTSVNVPAISGVASASITQTSATIGATVAGGTSGGTATVEYGTTASYGSTKNMTPIFGMSATNVSASLTGLTSNTTYFYRIKAKNSTDSAFSAQSTFKTAGAGGSIVSVTQHSIQLFPNPSQESVIMIPSTKQEVVDVYAIDITGQLIRLEFDKLPANHYKMNTKNLSMGKYYIRVKTNDGNIMHTKPLIIE